MTSFPWDNKSETELDRNVGSEYLAMKFIHKIANEQSGIYTPLGTKLSVREGMGMYIHVFPGDGVIQGRIFDEPDVRTLQIQASETLDRIDLVVARRHLANRDIELFVITGEAALIPRVPELVRTEEIYDVGIATVTVPKLSTFVSDSNIGDLRLNTNFINIIPAIGTIDTSDLYNQIQSDLEHFQNVSQVEFNEWFETIKGVLGEDVAGKLFLLIQENTNNIGNLKKQIEDFQMSIVDFGGVPEQQDFDNSIPLQKAIDFMYDRGGGTVFIPEGEWVCMTEVMLKPRVRLCGAVNALAYEQIGVRGSKLAFAHNGGGAGEKIFIHVEKPDHEMYYAWNISIEHLGIGAKSASPAGIKTIGLELNTCGYLFVNDVSVTYFDTGIRIGDGMFCNFNKIMVGSSNEYSVYYKNIGVSSTTTQRWEQCYFGQNPKNDNFKGCIVADDDILSDITLNSCTFESTPIAMVMGVNSSIWMSDLYLENVPNMPNKTAFSFFKPTTDTFSWVSNLKIDGAKIFGNQLGDWDKGTMLFNVDAGTNINFTNVYYRGFEKVLNVVHDKKRLLNNIVFRNCVGEAGLVKQDINNPMYRDFVVAHDCSVQGEKFGTSIKTKLTSTWGDRDAFTPLSLVYNSSTHDVVIEGSIKKLAGSTTSLGTVPKAARPSGYITSPVYGVDSTGSFALLGNVNINSLTGDILYYGPMTVKALSLNIIYNVGNVETVVREQLDVPKLPEIFNHKPYYLRGK